MEIKKIMGKMESKENHLIKYILGGEAVYYNEEALFCLISETTVLNLETMDIIYAI